MELETIVLTDPKVPPTDEIVFSIIGENKNYWEELIEFLYDSYSDISEQWRFYNDGKSWLYRTLRKKKTIYWIGVQKDTFRVSFWFGEKAGPIIEASSLPESVKEEYRNARQYKIGRCVTTIVRTTEDLESLKKLIVLKQSIR